jgi:hypothetical protein
MRCLILIACFVFFRFRLGAARPDELPNIFERENEMNNLYGSDDVDDYIPEYLNEIRRERLYKRNQCPRDMDETDDEYQTEYDQTDYEFTPRRRHQQNHQYQNEDEQEYSQFPNRYETEQEYPSYRRHQKYSRFEQDQDQDYETTSRNDLLKEVEDANAKLASRLYKQSKDEKDDKNTVVSPLSVQLALAALNAGARGNTKKQIGRVIGGRLQKQERKQIFKTLVRHLKGLSQSEYGPRQQTTKIHSVTGIIVTKTTRAQQMFIQQVKRNLGATVKQCNFQRQPQQCRQMINQFVSQKTQGKINRIVPQDAITDNTKMILVNALELKAPWGRQMRQHQTKEAKFYPLDTKKVKIVEVMET